MIGMRPELVDASLRRTREEGRGGEGRRVLSVVMDDRIKRGVVTGLN